MSASRAPRTLVPIIGLAVRIDSQGDVSHDHVGWISDIRGRIARVDFGYPVAKAISRWFTFSELIDEHISQIELMTHRANCLTAGEQPFTLVFEYLDYLDALELTRCPKSPAPPNSSPA
jgi:hypothetical protein